MLALDTCGKSIDDDGVVAMGLCVNSECGVAQLRNKRDEYNNVTDDTEGGRR